MVNGCGGEDALENGHEDAASGGTSANDPKGTPEPAPAALREYQEPETTTSTTEVGTETKRPKTTTIGTIALQSGDTRLVIALLEVRLLVPASD